MRFGDSIRRRRGGRRKSGGGVDDAQPAAPPPRSDATSGRRVRRAAVVAGLSIVGFGLGYLGATRVWFPVPPPATDLRVVPDLQGTTLDEVVAQLTEAGLVLNGIDSVQHPGRAPGEVLGQSPLAGQLALPGAGVWVAVSLGAQERPVPDVRRLRTGSARTVLEAAGFLVVVDSTVADMPRGRIAEVMPEPGTALSVPGEVRISVSTGPALIAVPLLLGLEQGEAEALLDSLGLVVSEVTTRFRFGRDQGRVVEQEPPPDSLVTPGSAIRLVVGRRRRGGGSARN